MNHQKHEFDEYAEKYHENLDNNLKLSGESSDYFALLKIKNLKKWLSPFTQVPLTILDFGCGDGLMTSYLQKEFDKAHVFGVDPSSKSIKIAQDRFKNVSFDVSGNLIPHKDKMFDLVTAAGVFHHIEFEKHNHYMQEVTRVLKPGGTFVMFELNPLNPGTQYIFRNNPIDQHAKMLRPGYAQKLMQEYGTVQTKYYAFFPGFLRFLRPLENFIAKIPLGALVAYIFKATKN